MQKYKKGIKEVYNWNLLYLLQSLVSFGNRITVFIFNSFSLSIDLQIICCFYVNNQTDLKLYVLYNNFHTLTSSMRVRYLIKPKKAAVKITGYNGCIRLVPSLFENCRISNTTLSNAVTWTLTHKILNFDSVIQAVNK